MNDTVKAARKRYLAGEITHQDYYRWLANYIGFRRSDLMLHDLVLRGSKDPHLNDIPLSLWDRHYGFIAKRAREIDVTGLSLAEAVCIAKAVAKEYLEKLDETTQ